VEVGLPYEAPFRLTGGVTLANERLYSVELPLWYYVPTAAHGDNAVRNFTFDLETGKRVLLADLFLPDSDWTTTLEASLEVALRDSKTAGTIQHLCTLGSGPWEYEDSVYADTFNVTEDALRIYHWLAPYACRVEPFDIPYADLVDVLDPDGPLQPCEMSQGTALVATCRTGDVPEAVFDVANATFDVRCPGILGGGAYPRLTTFVDGAANDPFGERGFIKVWEEAAIFELVAESPGPEVIARIDCSGGGSGTSTEIQVFAGHTNEATRLGRIIEGSIYQPRTFGLGDGGFHTKHWDWQGNDHTRTPSIYRIVQHTWVDGDWADEVDEAWERTIPPAGSSVAFDVANATFGVSTDGCDVPMTFTNGEWTAVLEGYGGAWVTEFAVVELVEESPGPEVVADIGCWSGGTLVNLRVVVFAGNSSEAKQLGRTLKGSVEWVNEADWSSDRPHIVIRYEPWLRPDPHCCPSQYELDLYRWQDGDWVEIGFEVWRKDPDAERL
jgi:hypothetical protein